MRFCPGTITTHAESATSEPVDIISSSYSNVIFIIIIIIEMLIWEKWLNCFPGFFVVCNKFGIKVIVIEFLLFLE